MGGAVLASDRPSVVTKGTFVDFLQLRGEIRPIRSVVLSAPSTGIDFQIVDLVKNGAKVSTGDIVVEFDPTVQQRTLETKRSELKQAESEIERTEAELSAPRRGRPERARGSAQGGGARQARRTGERARARVEAEKYVITCRTPRYTSASSNREGRRRADGGVADVAMQRQKREKAQYDVQETERIMGALTRSAPRSTDRSRCCRTSAPAARSRAPRPNSSAATAPGSGAPIAELPDLTGVKMTARSTNSIARASAGQRRPVRVDAVPDRELTGSLTDISVVAKPDFSSLPPARNFDLDDRDRRHRSRLRPA